MRHVEPRIVWCQWSGISWGKALSSPTQHKYYFRNIFLPLVSRYWWYLSLTEFTTVSDITGPGWGWSWFTVSLHCWWWSRIVEWWGKGCAAGDLTSAVPALSLRIPILRWSVSEEWTRYSVHPPLILSWRDTRDIYTNSFNCVHRK